MIIALAGKKHQGKDVIAEGLRRAAPDRVLTLAFADILKDGVASLFGIERTALDNQDLKETEEVEATSFTYRQTMQMFGDGIRDAFGEDIFIRLITKRVRTCLHSNKVVIITDLRTKAELKWVREMGGRVVRVVRPRNPTGVAFYNANDDPDEALQMQGGLSRNSPSHLTETELDMIKLDGMMINGGSASMAQTAARLALLPGLTWESD
jgi:phosphomevalonate kinase